MISLKYKNRIYLNKFSIRGLRYILADQAVRVFPSLKKRWLFPTESVAPEDICKPIEKHTVNIPAEKPPPAIRRFLAMENPATERDISVFDLSDITVKGHSGSLQQNDRLIDGRNWANEAKPQRMKLRHLGGDKPFYSLVGSSANSGHVFHWTFDFLMPLFFWLSEGKTSQNLQLLVNSKMTEYQKKSLAYVCKRFGLDPPIPLHPNEAAHVERLIFVKRVPSLFNTVFPQSSFAVLDSMAEVLAGTAKTATKSRRRIYISRADSKKRRVLNETKLAPIFEAFGIEPITLSGQPFSQQIAQFQSAEWVIAPHGAGLLHLAWCRPETRVVEFFPSPDGPISPGLSHVASCYWCLAHQRNLQYQALEAGPCLDKGDFEIQPEIMRDRLSALDSR